MKSDDVKRFLDISIALTSERDREALLSSILDTAMDIADCDAGTLYLLEGNALRFCRMVTRSMGVRQGGHDAPITLPPVPMEEKYVSAWCAIHAETINVADVRTEPRFDFSGSIRYDNMTGYRTKSMLVVPMRNDRGELIGVTQLINAQNEAGETVPFPEDAVLLIEAVSSQAAISITNMKYSQEITLLLDSLVSALSTAIDERTPYNANHTRNMVKYGTAFLNWLDAGGHPWAFSAEKRRAFLMAVWLHDVGKLVVPLEVMDKESRLGSKLREVKERLATIGLLGRIDKLEGRKSGDEYAFLISDLAAAEALIEKANRAGFLPDETLAEIEKLADRTYTDESGAVLPWITGAERDALSVRKGTLTPAERGIMESHVVVTAKILRDVYFPKTYHNVPRWAAAHHELLNGRGYPDHLTAEDIPDEVRLLTILDVFDALTARDRPYKPAMPVEKALSILHSMVSEGAIDGKILELFEKSKAWEAEN